MRFADKVAVVTGGASGIGAASARRFHGEGASVVIADLNDDLGERLAAELGARALYRRTDVSVWAQVESLVAFAVEKFGRLDILFNNAGMSPAVPSHEVTEQLFDSVLNLNFKGPFRLAALIAKRMHDGDGGVIINVSSSGALKPLPKVVPYSAAKSAINAMSVSFAREYGPKVRVNSLVPGPFLTDIANAWTEEAREKSNNSMGRPGRPEEIVTTALYLASPASSFVTGAVVRVDGGDS